MSQDFAFSSVPQDFPDIHPSVIETLIEEMKQAYLETAKIASMTFDRSILWQEARILTEDMIDKYVWLLK